MISKIVSYPKVLLLHPHFHTLPVPPPARSSSSCGYAAGDSYINFFGLPAQSVRPQSVSIDVGDQGQHCGNFVDSRVT